jgi:hypothetical protein
MKSKALVAVSAVVLTMCALPSISSAAPGDCAKEKSSRVSKQCRNELGRAMDSDYVSQAVRKSLEASYPLKACQAGSVNELEVKYTADDAVGPVLEVSAFVACESENEAVGYVLTGEYFIDGGGYRFKQITLSTAE